MNITLYDKFELYTCKLYNVSSIIHLSEFHIVDRGDSFFMFLYPNKSIISKLNSSSTPKYNSKENINCDWILSIGSASANLIGFWIILSFDVDEKINTHIPYQIAYYPSRHK